MKIQIQKCTHCPKMPDCEHRAMVKQADVPVRSFYHCKIYPTLFSVGDEVLVQLNHFSYTSSKRTPLPEKVRAVVVGLPPGNKKKFAIALFDEIELSQEGDPSARYFFLKVFADQMTFVQKYHGGEFWQGRINSGVDNRWVEPLDSPLSDY